MFVEFGLRNLLNRLQFHESRLTENCTLLREGQKFMFAPPYLLTSLGRHSLQEIVKWGLWEFVSFVKIGAMKFTFAPPYLLTNLGDILYRKSSSNGFNNLWVSWKLVPWNLRSHRHIYWPIWETFFITNPQVNALRICECRENWCHEIYPDLAVQTVGQLCLWFIHLPQNSGIFYTGDIQSTVLRDCGVS